MEEKKYLGYIGLLRNLYTDSQDEECINYLPWSREKKWLLISALERPFYLNTDYHVHYRQYLGHTKEWDVLNFGNVLVQFGGRIQTFEIPPNCLLYKARVYPLSKYTYPGISCENSLSAKISSYPNEWEYYICSQLLNRVKDLERAHLAKKSVPNILSYDRFVDYTVVITKSPGFGTLTTLIEHCLRKRKVIPEDIAAFFSIQLLTMVSEMHYCGIMHTDIKSDNIMVMRLPSCFCKYGRILEYPRCLQLANFEKAIDLTAYPPGTVFKDSDYSNDYLEMTEGKPWLFQIDLYNTLAVIHALLFSFKMKTVNDNGVWRLKTSFAEKKYKSIWESLFEAVLNITDYRQIPDLQHHINSLIDALEADKWSFNGEVKAFKLFTKELFPLNERFFNNDY